ncbi:MAG: hypothetical protein J07HX5_01021 [halophilic archaeon J07HX5]|nr:MAG: hypothetical protein J07HX5_01021 [halophilic archaeon J07HX5]
MFSEVNNVVARIAPVYYLTLPRPALRRRKVQSVTDCSRDPEQFVTRACGKQVTGDRTSQKCQNIHRLSLQLSDNLPPAGPIAKPPKPALVTPGRLLLQRFKENA